MIENKTLKKEVVLLLIPPIINNLNFNYLSEDQIVFISDKKKVKFLEGEFSFEKEEAKEYKDHIEKGKKLIFVNYPRDEEEVKSLEGLNINVEKVIYLLFCSDELFTEMMSSLMICPFCWKISEKEKVLQDYFFVCDKEEHHEKITMDLAESFKKKITNDYLEGYKEILKNLSITKEKNTPFEILTIKEKSEIIDDENLTKRILELIKK